ncbi:hypothetical protein LAZ67_18000711 [Cordylochernes scorpioides]|uniref:Mos1 transposase HTH domain-containing protein n=1 Tax=Cordylochernes scorpioides TaxID=51811 RepID=A0ABY6LJB4_9ARAC|nr:hypothetical protein LAZ67_18000711 [Cordylochernes scorpioides]
MEQKLKQRICIEFCVKLQILATETFEMLNKAFPNDASKRTTVFEWHSRFKAGRISIEDDLRQGRPKFQRTDENELEQGTGISKTTIGKILKKTPAKFIPRFLTNEQKLCRLATCEDMLGMIRADPEWKDKIITGDETWVYGYDPETKRQSAEWRGQGEPRPKKSRNKVLLVAFLDNKGIVHHEYLPAGQSVIKEMYLGIFRRLREAIRKKRPEKWTNGDWILHHDNARPHTAHLMTTLLAKCGTQILSQPPYSPDIAPNDFFLFPKLKAVLKGRHFDTRDDIIEKSPLALKSIPKEAYKNCFDNWEKRWRWCVEARGITLKRGPESCYGKWANREPGYICGEEKTWRLASGRVDDTARKERGGRPIKFEDAELEALLDEDSSQTQEELAETLEVTQQAISNRLKVMGMVQKQGNWVPYELKPGNIERRICTCELLLKRQNRKGFLHRIVTGDEEWIHYDNPKRRKSWVEPGHASTSTAKPNIHGKKLMLCIWWDQLGVIYYELLQPNETITGERYQQQLMRLSRALKIKRPLYAKRHDKGIYQHDNARSHVAKVVKETLEALQWDVLPHPAYSPDIAPSDYHMFRSMTHGLAEQHYTSYEEAKNWVNVWIASKDEEFFRHGIRMLPERWEKVVAKDGQYFE